MKIPSKKTLRIGLAIIAGLLALFIGATYFLNTAKPRLERQASAALGMEVTCRKLSFSFLPPAIAARGIKIDHNGAQVARIATIKARLGLPALIGGRIRIAVLRVIRPEVILNRLEDGAWNFEWPEGKNMETSGGRPFLPAKIDLRDGSLLLTAHDNSLEIRGIELTALDLVLAGNGLSLAGDFRALECRWNELLLRDLTSHLQGREGRFVFDPVIFQGPGGMGRGRVEADMTGKIPLIGAHLEMTQFRLGEFFTAFSREELLKGNMDLVADLTARGRDRRELLRSMDGEFAMRGRNLTIAGLDLDHLLEEYVQSQKFNLVDLGAYAIVGPLGPFLTKGYDFSGVAGAARGGSTEVRELLSLWRIEAGTATAGDVALATGKNRMAMKGRIDIVDRLYRNLVVAVVDDRGCALVRQEMNGPFDRPEVAKPSFIETAAGPILSLFKGAAKMITGEDCEVFYAGAVTAPPG